MSDTALTLNVPLSEADRAFLLIACGDITDDSTRSRPGASELTAQGVLDLRARLKAADTAGCPALGTQPLSRPDLERIARDASERVHRNGGCVPQLAFAPILFALQDAGFRTTTTALPETEADRFAASKEPHPRWNAEKPGERHPKSREEWDWHEHRGVDVALRRLAVAADYSDPRAPDQMATVLRVDLMAVTGDYVRLRALVKLRNELAAKSVSDLNALPVAPTIRYFPADFAPDYQTVSAGGLALPADALSGVSTLPGRHADLDAFAVNLRATIDDDAEACGICDVVFIRGDRCLTDISLGPVHARCCGPEREGYVNLETGEPLADDAPIPTPWIWNADGTISPGAKVEPCHCVTSGNGAEGCGLCNETGEVAA